MSQEIPPEWLRRTQAASHTAGAPQEQPPYCFSCQSLPASAPRCQTLPETSLQAAACSVGPPHPTPGWPQHQS